MAWKREPTVHDTKNGNDETRAYREKEATTEIKFEAAPPRWRLGELVFSEAVNARVRTAVARVKHHDVIYNSWGLSAVDPRGTGVAINLYGPPGTGKTACGEAIADELGKKIICVSYAEDRIQVRRRYAEKY